MTKVKAKGTQKKASPSSEESESDSDSDSKKPIKASPVVQIKDKVSVPLAKSNSSGERTYSKPITIYIRTNLVDF